MDLLLDDRPLQCWDYEGIESQREREDKKVRRARRSLVQFTFSSGASLARQIGKEQDCANGNPDRFGL